jgi:hypothetical protein
MTCKHRLSIGAVLLLLLMAAGCRNNDLVEAQLRTCERDLRETREALCRLESHNDALQRELITLHQGPGQFPPEYLAQVSTVRRIVLGRQTGGYNEDYGPADTALQVVLEPRDGEDQRIKAPGSAHIEAIEITPEGLKMPLSAWDVPPEQMRRSWREGLFGTGYYLMLSWKVRPKTTTLRVVARFTLPDGRIFEADRDVSVHLPSRIEPHGPLPTEPSGPVLVDPFTPLPSPQPLQSAPPAPASPPSNPAVPPPPRPVGPDAPPPSSPEGRSSLSAVQQGESHSVSLRRPIPLSEAATGGR